jgi:phenylacetic acid degradation operon negative regulatory protein
VPIEGAPGRGAQPRSLIVTLYGAYARETGGWLSVRLVVRLLAELGVEEAAVRSSVSRLKRRGLLEHERRQGSVGYALSASAQEILAAGDRRIFRTDRARLADGWVVVVFSVPEAERASRHVLRSELARLGLGTVASGTWIGPAWLADDVQHALHRSGLDAYADLFAGQHLAFGDLRARVADWWDLPGLQAQYGTYVEHWSAVLTSWRRRRAVDPRLAFADYVSTLTEWRRLPYLDPGLPVEVLPARWQGSRAAEVFFGLRDVLSEPAHEHVETLRRG